jgi:hypothetical protein
MEDGMKVMVEVHDKVTSVDLVDGLMRARLAEIHNNLEEWNGEPDIQAACKTLLDWMGNPHAQD